MPLDTSPSWANAATRPMSAILAKTRWQTTLYEDALAIVIPFVVTRLLLVLIGCTTALYLVPLLNPSQPIHPLPGITQVPAMFWLMWDHFDAGFYLGIARSGYWPASTLKGMSNWAFFPLYPLLVRGVALLIGTQHHSAYLLAGLIVSAGATLAAEIALYQLAWREWSRPLARRAVWLLMIFPTSFYLSAQYPESLALALSLFCCFFVRKRAWWRAGVTGWLAALTHPQGVLLVLVAGYEAWQMLAEQEAPYQRRATWFTSVLAWCDSRLIKVWTSFLRRRTWLLFLAVALIPTGLALFGFYGYLKTGFWTPFTVTEHNGWGRSPVNPVVLLIYMLRYPRPASPYDWNFYALNMGMVLFSLALLIPIFRRLPFAYGLYMLANILLPLTAGETNSIARFTLGLFPIYLILSWWIGQGKDEVQQERRFGVLLVTSAMLLALCMVLFTVGVYSIS